MYERENILRIFQETKNAVVKKDSREIRRLSDQTTNSASLTHDPDNIAAAVIVYSLSEMLERGDYEKLPGWEKFYRLYLDSIDKIIEALKNKDDNSYRENISKIREFIEKLSGKLKENIQEVFRRASIDKASKIYNHGISMGITAKLLGVTLFELTDYARGNKFHEISGENALNVKTRIKFAMDIFK
ncbi:hypothetical protein K0A97_02230 [Patescibacteria group bacterium]|nr:hypothetical protein [Patescibacteria group bacterium]